MHDGVNCYSYYKDTQDGVPKVWYSQSDDCVPITKSPKYTTVLKWMYTLAYVWLTWVLFKLYKTDIRAPYNSGVHGLHLAYWFDITHMV